MLFGLGSPLGTLARITPISEGWRGTEQTIQAMARVAARGGRDPQVRFIAERAIGRDLPNKAYRAECERLYSFLKRQVRYVQDPRGMEWLQTPKHLLTKSLQGDCDCHSAAYAALALSLGHESGFRAIKADPAKPKDYSHVYAIVRPTPAGGWVPADTTEANAFGQKPEDIMRRKYWGAKEWVIHPENDYALPLREEAEGKVAQIAARPRGSLSLPAGPPTDHGPRVLPAHVLSRFQAQRPAQRPAQLPNHAYGNTQFAPAVFDPFRAY